jgi:hypothetical protein
MRALLCHLVLCFAVCSDATAQTSQPSQLPSGAVSSNGSKASAAAQTPQQFPQTNAETDPSGSSSATSLREYREILKEERQLLEAQSEKYYTRIDKLIDRTLYGLGLVAAAALVTLGWGFGKTRSELRNLVHEQFQNLTSSLIQSEIDGLRETVQGMKEEIGELRAFQNRSVVWVFPGSEIKSQQELDALHSTGLHGIQCLAPANGESFEIGEPDLVIFSYDGTEECIKRLRKIVESLKNQSPPVTLLIYTYNPGGPEHRLKEAEMKILEGFIWFVPVNFPSTLIAQTQLLVRKERKKH